MTSTICRWPHRPDGRIESVHWQSPRRWFWIGRSGLGFGGSDRGYNAHWYSLRHPWRRWSRGDYRGVDFFKQIARGLREFVRG